MTTKSHTFEPGQQVTVGQYEGTIVREYLPEMYEVKLRSGMVVKPAREIHAT